MKRLACLALLLVVSAPGPSLAKDAVAFAKTTGAAEVELTLPKGLDAWPAFRDSLTASDRAKLTGFFKGPGGVVAKGGRRARNWRRIGYQVAGSTRRLSSVLRRDESYTGGAHPLLAVSGVIWDQRTKRRLPMAALFRTDTDTGPLDHALCDTVKAAKAKRPGAVRLDGHTWRCPSWSQASAALAPSTVAHRAGGLIVAIGPGEVGPYVEGPYRVLVPYARFRHAVKPAYAPEFAGAPAAEALPLLSSAPARAEQPRRKPRPASGPEQPSDTPADPASPPPEPTPAPD